MKIEHIGQVWNASQTAKFTEWVVFRHASASVPTLELNQKY